MSKALRVVVHGRMRGSFYRDSCRREAQRLGVRGCVRNHADGILEGVFAGDRAAVNALVE